MGVELFKPIRILACLCLPWGMLFAPYPAIKAEQKKTAFPPLKRIAEYNTNTTLAISGDGKYAVCYQWDVPISDQPKPDGFWGIFKKRDTYTQALRLVEISTGREITHVKVGNAYRGAFLPDRPQIVFMEAQPSPNIEDHIKIWDYETGQVRACIDTGGISYRTMCLLDSNRLLLEYMDGLKSELRVLDLSSGTLKTVGYADPEKPELPIRVPVAAPGKGRLAYFHDGELIIRDTKALGIIKKITFKEHFVLYTTFYSKNERYLFVSAGMLNSKSGSPDVLFCFDTLTNELIRQVEIPDSLLIDVSPDGKLMAFSDMETRDVFLLREVKLLVRVYDMDAGRIVASGTHFVGKSFEGPTVYDPNIFFTADGNYLVSSSWRVCIWDIREFTAK